LSTLLTSSLISASTLKLFQSFAANEFIEVALFSSGCFLLHNQSQVAPVKLLEPVVPADLFQRLVMAFAVIRKHQTYDSDIAVAASSTNASGLRVAFLCPLQNHLMIGQHSFFRRTLRHHIISLLQIMTENYDAAGYMQVGVPCGAALLFRLTLFAADQLLQFRRFIAEPLRIVGAWKCLPKTTLLQADCYRIIS
jgi:hypothetical protein